MTLPLDQILTPSRAFPPLLPAVVIRSTPDDFVVDEIPKYEPCGSGEHAYLCVEKRDLPAGQLAQRLSQRFGIKVRDVGIAGQKDKRAVTRQTVSVPAVCQPRITSAANGSLKVLSIDRHTNKLRTGHLAGNRFEIILRHPETQPFTSTNARQVVERLQQLETDGFPNYFGPQRFGRDGSTLELGCELLQPGERPRRRRKPFLDKLAVSAVQSAIFNLVVARRVASKTFGSPVAGDIVCRRSGIKPFPLSAANDIPIDELTPMGPMPGAKMLPAEDDVRDAEIQAIESLGLSLDDFQTNRRLTPGTRRKMVEFATDTHAELTADGHMKCQFTLPSGSFATVALAEIAQNVIESTGHTS